MQAKKEKGGNILGPISCLEGPVLCYDVFIKCNNFEKINRFTSPPLSMEDKICEKEEYPSFFAGFF